MVRPPSQTDGLRLGDAHAHLEAKGFDEQFKVAPGGRVHCLACGTESPAQQLRVDSQKRIEGVSDPAEESLVVGVQCPACDGRGALTLAYGPRADRDEAAVLGALPEPSRPPSGEP